MTDWSEQDVSMPKPSTTYSFTAAWKAPSTHGSFFLPGEFLSCPSMTHQPSPAGSVTTMAPQPKISPVFGHSPGQGFLPVTPPRSPKMEYDLDELVATIPEILEASSVLGELKDYKEILNDLQSSSDQLPDAPMDRVSSIAMWGTSPPTEAPPMLKKDIMWGLGVCSTSPNSALHPSAPFPQKARRSSESDDTQLSDPLRSYHSEDEEEHLPETPLRSDVDEDEAEVQTPPKSEPRSSFVGSSVFKMEHDYCGPLKEEIKREPSAGGNASSCFDSSADLVSSLEVLKINSEPETRRPIICTTLEQDSSPAVAAAATTPAVSMISAEVKRQLQITIHESMRSKQRHPPPASARSIPQKVSHPSHSPSSSSTDVSARPLGDAAAVVIRRRRRRSSCSTSSGSPPPAGCSGRASASPPSSSCTQGKPAAYTKRMREIHSEVLLSNRKKRQRTNSADADEGRRNIHNTLERQRRVEIRNFFEDLRLLVPETSAVEKAPKVQILKKGAQYCHQLHAEEVAMIQEKERLIKKMEALKRQKDAHFS